MFRLIFWLTLVVSICMLQLGHPVFSGMFLWLSVVTLLLGCFALKAKL